MIDIHQELRDAKARGADEPTLDKILAGCPDMECYECGEIICPYGERLHFHHDGCPSCAEAEGV